MSSRRRRFRARPKPQPKKSPTNDEIRSLEVRLIGVDGQELGIMSTQEALHRLDEAKTDLVIVAEKSDPPVARLMDIGKHMYEKRKKQAKQKKSSKSGNIKGVRIGFKTGEHDWNLRLNRANRFLSEGNKVKLEIRLRGREKSRLLIAEKKIKDFINHVPDGAKIEGRISKSPRGLSVLLTR